MIRLWTFTFNIPLSGTLFSESMSVEVSVSYQLQLCVLGTPTRGLGGCGKKCTCFGAKNLRFHIKTNVVPCVVLGIHKF